MLAAFLLPICAAPAPALQLGVLQLVVDGKRCGDGLVELTDTPQTIEAGVLERCGLDLGQVPRTSVDGVATVRLADLGDVKAELDPVTLVLHLDVPATLWKTQELGAGAESVAARSLPEAPSFHFDFAPRVTTGGLVEMSAESGVRAFGVAVSSGLQASNVYGVSRGLSRAVYDHRPTLLRFVVGDETVGGSALGSSAVIGGVTVRRTAVLDPERSRGVALGISDVAETPSELEVYVNDGLVRRERVQPGPFRIDDLARPAGAGEVRYVLRDAYGVERSVTNAYFSTPGLLMPGEHEGSYSAGVVRDLRLGDSWTYERPALVLDHRFGATTDLTISGHIEASPLGARGGPSFLTSVGSGTLELALGVAASAAGPAAAAQATYARPSDVLSWSVYLRGASPEYALDPLAVVQRARVDEHPDLGAGLSLSVAIARWSVSLELTGDTRSEGQPTGAVRASASGTLFDDLSTYAGGRATSDGVWEVAAGLRWSFDDGLGVGLDNTVQGDAAARMQLRADRRVMDSEGWGASGRLAFDPRSAAVGVDASAVAQTRYGRVAVRGLASPQGLEGVAELSSSLVAVWGGGLFLSSHQADGYALVEVPEQEGVRVYLDHREVGVTDGDGVLLVSGLRAYETQRLSIASTDVSLDAVISTAELSLAVPPRGASVLRFPVRRAQFVRGVLERGGTPLRYGELTARCGDTTATSPIGSDGAFELDTPPPGTCQLAVSAEGGACRAQIEVSGTDAIRELGTVRCEAVSP